MLWSRQCCGETRSARSREPPEAEIVGAGDFLKDVIWARHFLQAQGFDMNSTKMYQDNMIAIKIEKKRKEISRKNQSSEYVFTLRIK